MADRTRRLLSAAARVFFALTLVIALTLVWVLAAQNQRLVREVRDLRIRSLLPREGTPVLPFRAVTLDGDSVTVGAADSERRQVLFVFNTRCPFCLQTLPAWATVAERLASTGSVQVLGLSLDSLGETRPYVEANRVSFPVTVMPDARTRDLWDIQVVPAILVVDSEALVRFAQSGALADSRAVDSIVTAATTREDRSGRSGQTVRSAPP